MAKGDSGGFSGGDIQSIIQAQSQANRVNTITPFGRIEHQIDRGGSRNDNKVRVSLSPEQQALLEQMQGGQLQAGQIGQTRLGELGAGREAIEQAQFQRALGLLNPEFARQESALQNRLANQGLPQTSGAYNREYGRFEDTRNRALEQAALASVLAGGQEESRLAQMSLGLMGMGQPTMPQQVPVAPVTVPVQQQQGGASPLAGLLGLGGLAAGGFYGGIPGAQLGFTSGSNLPALFGMR